MLWNNALKGYGILLKMSRKDFSTTFLSFFVYFSANIFSILLDFLQKETLDVDSDNFAESKKSEISKNQLCWDEQGVLTTETKLVLIFWHFYFDFGFFSSKMITLNHLTARFYEIPLGGKEDDCAGVLRPEHLEKLIAADSETVVEIELKRIIIIRVIVMKKWNSLAAWF